MPAFGRHKTDVIDKPWDAAKNVKNARSGESLSYYWKIFAWYPEKDEEVEKSDCKLPHHEVSADGTPGAANLRGCIAAIAALNGARGGVDIPDADRKEVYNHVAGHLKDAEYEPPELKTSYFTLERRCFEAEIRADKKERKIFGHAAVFNSKTSIGTYDEVIKRGAFTKTLKEADVRALFNHDVNFVLGRTSAGTLKLEERDEGLYYEVTPPDTQWAKDLIVSIERGDIRESSFSFIVHKENWTTEDKRPLRIIEEVELFDVSPVTFPAYPETDSQVRTISDIARVYILQQEEPQKVHSSTEDELALLKRKLVLLKIKTWR